METRWEKLYKLQDRILALLQGVEQGFHLSGGTALSRGYYNHRYSEDLDFFVNDREEFELWRDRCLAAIQQWCSSQSGCSLQVVLREERFGRALLTEQVDLKLEFINDVPSRVGEPIRHPVLGLLDTRENILANKITALVDRGEPKDIADIYWLCCRDGLSIEAALAAAEGKAAGIFPPLVAKRLEEASRQGVPNVYWIRRPTDREFAEGIHELAASLLCL